jgi:hypothetical protein
MLLEFLIMKIILFTLALLTPLAVSAQDWYAEDIPGLVSDEVVPVVPGIPAPPNYYGVANGAYRKGYTVVETERQQFDPYRAATGFMDPFYKQKTIQVVPNDSSGTANQPWVLGK